MKKIKEELVSQDELMKALTFIKTDKTFAFEDSLKEASYYSNAWCLRGDIEPVEKELDIYEEVARDPEFIRETAQKLFSTKPVILIIGQDIQDVRW